MPHYEFFCHNCKKSFSNMLTLARYEKGKIICPRCGSKRVEQSWSAFTAITSKKSARFASADLHLRPVHQFRAIDTRHEPA